MTLVLSNQKSYLTHKCGSYENSNILLKSGIVNFFNLTIKANYLVYINLIIGMMLKNSFILTLLILLALTPSLFATIPPLDVKLVDTPDDKGGSITLIFARVRVDTFEMARLRSPSSIEYEIWRSAEDENSFQLVGKIRSSDEKFIDTGVRDGVEYFYFIKGTGDNDTLISAVFGPVVSRAQWFNTKRTNVLLGAVIAFLFIFGFILYGRRKKEL
jgi:hypothetical protein